MNAANFRRIKGTSRYTDGIREISYRQYKNLQTQALGWRNVIERDKEAKHVEYKRWERYAKDEGLTKEQFQQGYVAALRSEWDKSFDSPFAKFLVLLGVRDADADYCVGCTPTKR